MSTRSSKLVSELKNNSEKPLDLIFRFSEKYGGYLLIEVGGSIDTYSKNYFDETVSRVIENGNVNIILDMENVFFISGTGVGTFIRLQRYAAEKGGNLILTGLNHHVLDIFQILGITDAFRIVLKKKLSEYVLNSDNNNYYHPKTCPNCGNGIEFADNNRVICSFCKSVIVNGREESSLLER